MTKYSLLNHRRMGNEIRLSYRQVIVIGISTFIAFIYALSRDGCAESAINKAPPVSLSEGTLPLIYAVTPTYYRPVQKAELTRYAMHTYKLLIAHLKHLLPQGCHIYFVWCQIYFG